MAASKEAMPLYPFQNAAGHGGVMQDEDGDIVVKPCTQAEIDFYQESLTSHQDFAVFMPDFMGTLKLGDHTSELAAAANATPTTGKKIETDTAIVLENIESGYKHPNVVDIKLGAKLYAPGTEASKAARLDKVASETTSGSLNFRVAGMKVWNERASIYDIYDKQYGRKFDDCSVGEAFTTFFATLQKAGHCRRTLQNIYADLESLTDSLESSESRSYSASVLLVYEGDSDNLAALEREQQKPDDDQTREIAAEGLEDDDSLTEDEALPPYRLKMIDFAHSKWCPGEGPDTNVIEGLKSISTVLARLFEKSGPD